ncbi:MAG TPA: CHASE domain-containing protein [Opitutaceae bacterium]|nr:CHASE domain-containing protein [Opitutaceae bacterium]
MADASRKTPFFSPRVAVGVVLFVGALASGFVFYEARQNELAKARAEFTSRASLHHALTTEILGRYEDALAGLRNMFTLQENVTRSEFVRATRRIEEISAYVRAFEWVPAVPAASRTTVEEAVGRSYGRAFQFTELNAQGDLVPAGNRPEYYPVCYVQPLAGNERAVGYDLKTGPTRAELERARRTRQMTLTRQVRLVQENADKLAVVMIWPAFRGADADTFLGFVQGIIDVRAAIERTRTTTSDQTNLLDALFIDASESQPELRMLHYLPAAKTPVAGAPPSEADFRNGLFEAHPMAMGGRDWQVLYRPRAGWLAEQLTAAPGVRGASVMLITLLVAGLMHTVGRRAKVIERIVTERTAELTESRRQLSSLMHSLPGMAFRCSVRKPARVLYASEGTLTLTGHPAEDFMEDRVHLRDFIHPDDLERVREATRAGLAAKREFEIEFRIRSRDGVERWLLSRSRGFYGPDGSPEVFEGLAIDITAQKRIETERIAIERKLLEGQKLESLGLLAGGIAHDFNNLLTGILGNASLVRLAVPLSETTDPQLRAIENAAIRAAELCRQMLAYAGKGRFVVEPTALGALVEGMLPLLKISIGRGVRVHLALATDLPFVMADATQLRQIAMNLVINASDAIGDQSGEIFLTAGMTSVDRAALSSAVAGAELPPGEYVYFEVRDTGCGMTPGTIRKIFDPFFSTKVSGRGLGLAAVLGIVRGHGGALQVESKPGQGSTFRLLLPPAAHEPARFSTTATARPWSHTANVLIIEDDEIVRTVSAEAIKTYGLTPHLAPNGEAGLALFRKKPRAYDLVLLDLVMPGLSGEETLAELRAIRADVAVILMSGYSETDTLARLADSRSPLEFLQKPFTREMLKVKLRSLLG